MIDFKNVVRKVCLVIIIVGSPVIFANQADIISFNNAEAQKGVGDYDCEPMAYAICALSDHEVLRHAYPVYSD